MVWHQIAEYPEYELKVIDSRWVKVRRISDHFEPSISGAKDGYKWVNLVGCEGKRHTVSIHVLVCLVYKGPRPKGKKGETVNHKDGCKWNNHPLNLEWASYKKNNRHALTMGLRVVVKGMSYNKGEKNASAKLTRRKVRRIHKMYSTGRYTQKELALVFRVSCSVIWAVIKGKNWKECLPK